MTVDKMYGDSFVVCGCCLLLTFGVSTGLQENAINVDTRMKYSQARYTSSCGLFGWDRCGRYRQVSSKTFHCRTGYRSTDNRGCPHAICDNDINPSACNINYRTSHIIYSDSITQYRSGGSCTSPGICVNCNRGFYPNNERCRMCSAISNCDLETCTSSSNQVCSRCDGVVSEQAGHRAYVASSDSRSCIQTCSWRSDSTWCYPGTCRNEYASNCACSSGFTGKHCQTITTRPIINFNILRLTASNGDVTEAPPNINSGPSQSTSWSNINFPSSMNYKFTAAYRTVPPAGHRFIEGFRVGIVSASATFKLKRGGGVVSTKVVTCGGVSRSSPDTDLYTCEGTSSGASVLPLPFQHRDVIEFSYATSNGGYVKVRNKETKALATHYYSGATQTHTFTVTIDLVDPYHCTGSTACVGSMLTAPNVIKTPTVNLRWSGWVDDDAGVDHFVTEVFGLQAVGDELRAIRRVDTTTLTSSSTSDSYTLTTAGVYSVVLSAYDKAGNHRSARRILIHDGSSTVTTQANKKLRVTTASSATSEWQTTSSAVTVDWTNRYINTVHHNNKWLHGVASSGGVGSDYDDNEGDRSVAAINNVQGVTRFLSSYKVDHKGGWSITSPPVNNEFVSQGLSQSQTITPSLADGDTVRFWIRAYDIKSDMKEEYVTVHIDTSPPVIENLWLTSGDRLNISVHSVEEFTEMTMEWVAYDEHSGLEAVSWQIVDKYRGRDIVHGVQHITAQGETSSVSDCKNTYAGAARGANCYCTPAKGCYHRHFQVKPTIVHSSLSHGGIFSDKSKGSHGSDYHLEVTVTNHAKLTTKMEFKITLDVSPPHSGIVHDGQSGQPEVDYQDNLQLNAHWDGFFDNESAIAFYQYTFGPRCLQGDAFDLNKTKNMESTHSTEVTWTAPSCGKFYATVVAYNGAQQRSDAVCSDGVETCKVCSAISNCDLETCTSSSNQVCSRCDGVVSEQAGHRAYVASSDRRSCIQACSWRSDSTRCYPGTCRNEYASNCVCSSGFTGKHCQTITTRPIINFNILRLTAGNGDVTEAPPNINSGPSQSTRWSNINSPSSMNYKFTAAYRTVPPASHRFIEGFRVGIVSASATFKLKRGGGVVSTKVVTCGGVSRSSPDTDLYTCEGTSSGASVLPLPFQHRDVIEFSYATSNGGYVKIRNKETKALATHYYSGATQTHTFTVTIDLVDPYHCTGSTACVGSMLTAPNVIKTPTVNLRWSGWVDDDAGVDHFVREMYELNAVGDELRDKRRVDTTTLTSSSTSDSYTLTTAGVYSVVLSAYDKAGNHRSARRILIYDGTSTVTTRANKQLRVTTASSATSEWQTTTSSAVTVDWTNRYINTVHHNNKWLHGVASSGGVGSDYDDNEGVRSVAAINNVQGVTRFLSSYKVDHKGGWSITSPPVNNEFVSQGLSQSQTITPSLADGDTVRFWIRAYDIKSDMKEEYVTVHIDTSPPVIENLWLTRGDRLNISVHRVEEFTEMTMEWVAYDEHSGLEAVSWRIVDKYRGRDIVHGVQHITAQGETSSVSDCKNTYASAARGANCYCTPAKGCYHRHFQVKPTIVVSSLSHGGIFSDKSKGSHGSDYHLEVTVTNHAKLTTKMEFKITLNVSPPHSGIVHDGQSGHPEVDYQDSLQLHAHWDGFFINESAIAFYQYTFGPRCLQGDAFDLNKTKNMESTHSTEVTWTAPSCGKFYVTVVAYNGAQQRSDAVCSDGVETCKGNPVVRNTLVLVASGTVSAVVAVVMIIVGVVVWKRKQRRLPESPDQAVYENTELPKNVKAKKTKPRANRNEPESKTYEMLDVNSRNTGPGEGAYCSIQTRGSEEKSMYEPIESPMYVNRVVPSRGTSDSTSNEIYEEI